MDRSSEQEFLLGDWRVMPNSGQICLADSCVRLEARSMRLLVYLAERAGEVVSIEELLEQVWPGVVVSPDSVYQAIAGLRKSLGDDPRQARYIATVPRMGYRLVAPLGAADAVPPEVTEASEPPLAALGNAAAHESAATPPLSNPPWLKPGLILTLLALLLALGLGLWSSTRTAANKEAIVVLPFLDLSPEMDQEVFADGMTESLIEMLGKQPKISVAARSLSFAYKGKNTPIGEIAKTLGVHYVLEGSVHKSGQTLRVSAQLVRVEQGFVVWSESYDRPATDLLMIQDDIAAEVGRALHGSLNPSSGIKPSKS
ncbi:winged helix-turn-helix domain-containing protein [Paucibacter sp. AS339]|uniref:winged helix-turn-helix domain-containing protein n=1 Tax=Paucibacter hankyongi TaxID=3133434 RepID=UPI0030A86EF4